MAMEQAVDAQCSSEVQNLRTVEVQQETLHEEQCQQIRTKEQSMELAEAQQNALHTERGELLEDQRDMLYLQESTRDESVFTGSQAWLSHPQVLLRLSLQRLIAMSFPVVW